MKKIMIICMSLYCCSLFTSQSQGGCEELNHQSEVEKLRSKVEKLRSDRTRLKQECKKITNDCIALELYEKRLQENCESLSSQVSKANRKLATVRAITEYVHLNDRDLQGRLRISNQEYDDRLTIMGLFFSQKPKKGKVTFSDSVFLIDSVEPQENKTVKKDASYYRKKPA